METIRNMCDSVVWIDNRVTRRFGPTEEIVEDYLTNGRKPNTSHSVGNRQPQAN